MAEDTTPKTARSRDDVALDLMKFIALQTTYGKGVAGAGFSAKTSRTPDEQVDALLELFDRCRKQVYREPEVG